MTDAKDALNFPSILLFASGAAGVLIGLARMLAVGAASSPLPAELTGHPLAERFAAAVSGPGIILGSLLFIALSGFVIFGALQMRSLQSYGVALAAALVSLIPCTGFFCLGLPVGIWALVVLHKPGVKSQFQE